MINRTLADQYKWGDGCDGWHLVRQPQLSVIQERMPPATSEIRHYHASARQFFYVLVGQLTIECAGVIHLLDKGDGLEISPREPHQVRNDSDADAEFLVVSQPPAQGDRYEAPSVGEAIICAL